MIAGEPMSILNVIFILWLRDMKRFVRSPSRVIGSIILPAWVRAFSYADPLTYGIEGLRASLLGTSAISMPISLAVCCCVAVLLVLTGAWFFETSEAV